MCIKLRSQRSCHYLKQNIILSTWYPMPNFGIIHLIILSYTSNVLIVYLRSNVNNQQISSTFKSHHGIYELWSRGRIQDKIFVIFRTHQIDVYICALMYAQKHISKQLLWTPCFIVEHWKYCDFWTFLSYLIQHNILIEFLKTTSIIVPQQYGLSYFKDSIHCLTIDKKVMIYIVKTLYNIISL